MLIAILTGIFGLAGVFLGGFITARTTQWTEQQRVQREDKKEHKARLAKLKQVARLLDDDFSRAMSTLNTAIKIKSYTALENVKLEIWLEHRALLASETTLHDWRILRTAAQKMELAKTLAAIIKSEGDVKVDELQITDWQEDKATIQKGCDVLKPLLDIAAD